jgi:ferritin
MFDGVLDHEIMVTESINKLTDHAFSAKDFGTFQFLLWFVEEQREEEEVARRAVELFELIGEAGQGKWMIDQEIKKLAE